MAGTPIDVVVTDKVAPGISASLRSIAASAREAYAQISGLQAGIDKFATSSSKLSSISARNNAALTQQGIAAARLSTAQANQATAEEKLALAKLRTLSATQKQQAAQDAATAAMNKASGAVNAFGETQAQAEARIKAVAAAGIAQAAAMNKVATAATQAAAATATLNSAQGSTPGQVARQTAQMTPQATSAASAPSVPVSTAASAATADLAKRAEALRNQIDPLRAATERYNAALAESSTLLKAGAISAAEASKANELASRNYANQSNNIKRFGDSTKFTRQQLLTFQYTFNDVIASLGSGISPLTILMQQGGQVTQAFGGLKNTLSTVAGALGPVGIAFAAVGAAIGLVIGVMSAAQKQINAVNNALTITGNFAGTTAGAYAAMAQQIGAATNTSDAAVRSLQTSLTLTGQLTATQVNQFTQAALQLSKFTGESADKIAADFAKAAEGPTAYAETFNRQFHILTPTQLEHIRQLEEMGKKTEALGILSQGVYEGIAKVGKANLSTLQSGWESLTRAVSNYFNAVIGQGRAQSYQEQIAALQSAKADRKNSLFGNSEARNKIIDEQYNSQIAQLQAQQAEEAKLANRTAETTQENQKAADAIKSLATEYASAGDNMSKYRAAVAKLDSNIAVLEKTNPQSDQLKRAKADYQNIVDDLKKKYLPDQSKADKSAARDEETRALTIAKINSQLTSQVANYGLLKEPREAANKMAEIEIELARKKITLSADERAQIAQNIDMITKRTRAQAAQDAVYEAATGPARTYSETLTSALVLYETGKISLAQYNEAVNKSKLAYETATAPLIEINRQLDQEAALLKILGPAQADAQKMQQIENELRQRGIDINSAAYASEKALLEGKIKANAEAGRMAQEENSLLDQSIEKRKEFSRQLDAINKLRNDSKSGFTSADANTAVVNSNQDIFAGTQNALDAQVDAYKNMYQRIAELRAKNFVDEQTAAQMRANVDQQVLALRLANTQEFFGSLATLSRSGNAKIAAIGKAAAVAQATIDGVLAVQKALASAPPPINYALAAAVGIAAASNVANIVSQSTGYEKGGYTGNAGTKEVAGVVHGQEFVVNAKATARNRATLEAMNDGKPTNGDGSTGKQVVIHYAPVTHIDSRTDQREVQKLVSTSVEQGNRDLVDRLERAGKI